MTEQDIAQNDNEENLAEETTDESQGEEQDIADTEEKIEETPEQIVERERAEYLAGWQRAQADMVNLKKRHDEERAMFTTLGKESLLNELVPMLDNFESAFANKEAWEAVDANWRMGIEYIYNQFLETLNNNGVEQFGAEGDSFDAQMHEPIESEGEGVTITTVMQKGYRLGDRIVRPAKVKLG